MHSFSYDRFQTEAIHAIREGISVFVSAPTGAGKTVIAEVAVEEAMKSGGMAIYTAPIKALSNQKYRDFYAKYGDKVGILTGDVTLNPDAPFLIMTTEIYRSSLFEGGTRFSRCRWVIFDEVHFLDDPERGTVWEEALLLTPRETEILALSATTPNAKELAAWIERIHGRPVKVILETHRPVPLTFEFQCQDEISRDLHELKIKGYKNQDFWRPRPIVRRPRRWRPSPGAFRRGGRIEAPMAKANRADHLMRIIQQAGHLPCLYFAFSRKRVEELAWEIGALGCASPESRAQAVAEFDQLTQKYQITHERSATGMRELVKQGVAFHHAGLLPTLKEVVEILFSKRLLQAIVTTETFALGVNMPARSVVLDTLVKRANGPRLPLRGRELFQMAGRAGRRGMDETGFVYLRVNPWELSYPQVSHLIEGTPEQVVSRFSMTYATVLNLYRGYRENLLPFYQKTFHAFQASERSQREAFGLVERRLTLLKKLGYIQPNGKLTAKGTFASSLYGYELILSELFEAKWLDELDWMDLGFLLAALVYEPRRGIIPPRLPRRIRALEENAQQVVDAIHKEERKLQITPMSKSPHFHLSPMLEKWLGGAAFEKVVQHGEVAEGELIRYFRMTLQLARTLATTPSASNKLKQNAHRVITQINRDPVDAEAELRRSL